MDLPGNSFARATSARVRILHYTRAGRRGPGRSTKKFEKLYWTRYLQFSLLSPCLQRGGELITRLIVQIQLSQPRGVSSKVLPPEEYSRHPINGKRLDFSLTRERVTRRRDPPNEWEKINQRVCVTRDCTAVFPHRPRLLSLVNALLKRVTHRVTRRA